MSSVGISQLTHEVGSVEGHGPGESETLRPGDDRAARARDVPAFAAMH